MKHTASRITSFACAAALTAIGASVNADEAEIFVGIGNTVTAERPNILFIIDTSGSMDTNVVTQVPFDPSVTYSGDCETGRVYFDEDGNSGDAPNCNNDNSVPTANFKCNSGTTNMALAGYYVAPQAAQWRRSSSSATKQWRSIDGRNDADAWVECNVDYGVHGNGVNLTRLWATNSSGPWTATAPVPWTPPLPANMNTSFWTGFDSYVFYSANYINWLNDNSTITQTRLEIVQLVATNTINSLAVDDAVNVGLMRFSTNTTQGCDNTAAAEGGMVLREMGPVAANRANLVSDIALLNADGCTPLSESMYEAYLYLSGGAVDYGMASRSRARDVSDGSPAGVSQHSIMTSRQAAPNTGLYQSPLTISCQKNFIVLLTDGLPTSDTSANPEIDALIPGSCAPASGQGRCLEEIAGYMYNVTEPNDMRPTLEGRQNVVTYTVGFGPEVAGSTALHNTATAGGGVFYEAKDTASLSTVLTNIARDILAFNTSFTAPAVSVNAFNRTQNLNDLYVTVFRPSDTIFWDGNIKKYHLRADGTIEDVNDDPAVEVTTGFFRDSARSFWSDAVDGDRVDLGGAAFELPDPATRKVYTDVSPGNGLTNAANALATTNATITDGLLGLGAGGDPTRDDLINWLRGADVSDANGDGVTTDPRLSMGDPMNGRPATVIYGGDVLTPDPTDGVVFAVTNEGYLHAINAMTGAELWAFMPAQMLTRARDLYFNEPINDREYGLDGNIRVVRNEVNENGVLEENLGETVRIYFGMRRGGSEYYGIDVTDRNDPVLLFKIGPDEAGTKLLPNAGQSWSTPSLAKVNIDSATQNTLKQVLVFGGGYDTGQDGGAYSVDDVGNQIFMVDAETGNLLWYAGPSADTAADLPHPSLTHSIPADVRVFDLTGDGFADRMYAADMGGRVWRFDIHNGQTRANLVTGGVFASLGNAHVTGTAPADHPASTTRRFYSAPDVAFLSSGGRTWINVAIGSGYRGHPLNVETQDRFYSLRDHQPFARLTQAQYDAATVITEADVNLMDITNDITPTIPAIGPGWRLDLRTPAGEKSLSEARTIQSMIQFTTYEPNLDEADPVAGACAPDKGINRLYTISAYTGAPVFDREGATDPDSVDDRESELAQGGIAPEVVWLFPSPDNPAGCVGAACRPDPVCLVGLENCGVGISLDPVRTFWRQSGVN